MTPNEAKTKWCPFVRVVPASHDWAFNADVTGLAPAKEVNHE